MLPYNPAVLVYSSEMLGQTCILAVVNTVAPKLCLYFDKHVAR